MKTRSAKAGEVERRWYVVDGEGQSLGRLASRIAMVLRGKNKGQYTPHVDTGDFVIVVNAEKIRLTGQKLSQKFYYRHTGFPGGIYSVVAGKLMATHPERLLRTAVSGMLPRTPMGRKVLGKLKVYAGTEHPHKAQKPEKIEF